MAGRQLRWQAAEPIDLRRTVGALSHGGGDPTARFIGGAFWWATHTPDGPGTMSLRMLSDTEVLAEAWGDGANWLLAVAPELLGSLDDWSELDVSGHPVLHEVRRRSQGVRLARSRRVMHSLVPAILEQRVTGGEARQSWRRLTLAYGERAPGPEAAAMWLPATADKLLAVPSWDWHRWRVDSQRYRAIRAAATVANRLEEAVDIALASGIELARRRLRAVPGIGEWTAAETTLRALGDPDAVSVGDFHVKNVVGWVLAGEPRSDDETMLKLLEPWRGHRARVIRLIELSGMRPPKYGPRFSPTDISKL